MVEVVLLLVVTTKIGEGGHSSEFTHDISSIFKIMQTVARYQMKCPAGESSPCSSAICNKIKFLKVYQKDLLALIFNPQSKGSIFSINYFEIILKFFSELREL